MLSTPTASAKSSASVSVRRKRLWLDFLENLKARGLAGVKLVISDARRRASEPRFAAPRDVFVYIENCDARQRLHPALGHWASLQARLPAVRSVDHSPGEQLMRIVSFKRMLW